MSYNLLLLLIPEWLWSNGQWIQHCVIWFSMILVSVERPYNGQLATKTSRSKCNWWSPIYSFQRNLFLFNFQLALEAVHSNSIIKFILIFGQYTANKQQNSNNEEYKDQKLSIYYRNCLTRFLFQFYRTFGPIIELSKLYQTLRKLFWMQLKKSLVAQTMELWIEMYHYKRPTNIGCGA